MRILCLLVVLFVAACNKPTVSSSPQAPTTPQPAAFDPVADLKALTAKLKWDKQAGGYRDVKVNVRRTDSLTAPFEGAVFCKQIEMNQGKIVSTATFALKLDCREGKWEFKECAGSVWTPNIGDYPFYETPKKKPVFAGGILKDLGISNRFLSETR